METKNYEQNIMRRAYVMARRWLFADRDKIIQETAQTWSFWGRNSHNKVCGHVKPSITSGPTPFYLSLHLPNQLQPVYIRQLLSAFILH